VPRLTSDQAAGVRALDTDPDHIAFDALRRGDRDGRIDALALWTSWRPETVALLLDPSPRLALVTEALNAGLRPRAGHRLRHGERATYDLLVQRYTDAGGRLPVENADELGLLRFCDRCDVVTRGPRNAARCPDCGHRHSSRINEEPPQFTPCPVCGVRPVTDARVRCEECETTHTKEKKAAQARRRRARQRNSEPPP
jgi:hypothetical protein